MKHIITLGSGRRVTVGQYVRAFKLAKENPQEKFRGSFTTWEEITCTGQEIVNQFYGLVTDKINEHMTILEDRKGPITRLLRYLQKHGRECKWCGNNFFPDGVSQKYCSNSCAAL